MRTYLTYIFLGLLFTPFFGFWINNNLNQYRIFLPMFGYSIATLIIVCLLRKRIIVRLADVVLPVILLLIMCNSLWHQTFMIKIPFFINCFILSILLTLFKQVKHKIDYPKVVLFICTNVWLIALVGIYGLWFQKLQNFDSAFNKSILGIFHNPSVLTSYLLLLFPIIVFEIQSKTHIVRTVCTYTAFLILGIFIFNQIRVCLFGAIIVLVIFFYSISTKVEDNNKNIKNKILLVVSIIFLILGFLFFFNEKKQASVAGKLLTLKISSQIILENPLFGIGYGEFPAKYMVYQSRYFQNGGTPREQWLSNTKYLGDSELLMACVELGIPLTVIIFGIIILALYKRYRMIVQANHFLSKKWFAWVLVLILLLCFSSALHFPEIIVIIFITMVLSEIIVPDTSPKLTLLTGSSFKNIQIIIVSISIFSLIYYSAIEYTLYQWDKRLQAFTEKKDNYKVKDLDYILFHNGPFVYISASVYNSQGDFKTAYRYIQQTNKIQVGSSTMLLEAEILKALGKRDFAYNKYKESVFAVPIQVESKYYLMQACKYWNDTTLTIRWAKSILSTPIKIKSEKRDFYNNRAEATIRRYSIK